MQEIHSVSETEAPKITLIGGGTGSFTLLQELKHLTPNISAVVNMSDNGGSSGKLRDELGVLPAGDVRQCMVALSNAPEFRKVFNYRFQKGFLKGQSAGNIIMAAFEETGQTFLDGVRIASESLRITGKVIPITADKHHLVMQDGDDVIHGEEDISHREIQNRNAHVWLEPEAVINPEAEEAISDADLIVFAPGNLYGSLLPTVVVKGVPEAVHDSNALTVVVTNLVTKPGQTDDWHVVDYVETFEQYLGKSEVDAVLYNSRLPDRDLLDKYAEKGEHPVSIEPYRFKEIGALAIGADLLASEIFVPEHHDHAIKRTLIRHDARRVGEQLLKIIKKVPS